MIQPKRHQPAIQLLLILSIPISMKFPPLMGVKTYKKRIASEEAILCFGNPKAMIIYQ
jgi:hypothetical protein